MKKGFTLIELSIVLIIVGLLVGGILVGQSLINSASMSKTISMLAQFDAAAMTYKSQFKYLPGDNPKEPPADTEAPNPYNACPNTPSGLGNGIIDGGCFVSNNIAGHYYGGLRQFWYIMSSRKFKADTLKTLNSGKRNYNTSGPNQSAYKAPIAENSGDTGFWVGCVGIGNNCNNSIQENYYSIVKINRDPNRDELSNLGTVKPADAMALDNKIDDGKADSGDVLSGNNNGGIGKTAVSADCSVGSIYKSEISDYKCIPIIRLGSQTGQKL